MTISNKNKENEIKLEELLKTNLTYVESYLGDYMLDYDNLNDDFTSFEKDLKRYSVAEQNDLLETLQTVTHDDLDSILENNDNIDSATELVIATNKKICYDLKLYAEENLKDIHDKIECISNAFTENDPLNWTKTSVLAEIYRLTDELNSLCFNFNNKFGGKSND